MNEQASKRSFNETSPDPNQQLENIYAKKHLKMTTNTIEKSIFQDLCSEIILEIFQYLRPIDLLYSFTGLYSHLDTLLEPYTHTLDFRLINKFYFQCLIQSLLPNLTNNLRVLRLSNIYTFSEITEMIYKFDWSYINQLESLIFDSIKSDELSKYCLDIHPLLQHLWRLSLTFDEDDQLAEKLLLDHILIPLNQSQSLKNCFIIGITFDLNKRIEQRYNENLRELTITLSTINDLIILFRIIPHLEILICTILRSTYNENIEKISSLDFLTILTITIKEKIIFNDLQKILIPHIKLQRLSLNAIILNENSNEEIGGLILEKFFRTFSQLTELNFYLRHLQNNNIIPKPNHLYLYSFTSHFWHDRSIKIFTHFIEQPKQRIIYTLPFYFDTFHIIDDIDLFFQTSYPYYYTNVHHLLFSSIPYFNQSIYLTKIFKFFPKIKTIKIFDLSSFTNIDKILNNHQWILQKSISSNSSIDIFPRVYILNKRKSTQWYLRTLDINNEDQRLFANNSKHIRQLTIYEMTEQQSSNLMYFFPWIHVLILHVKTSKCFSLSIDWLYQILTNMTSLFSLTIYYPKDSNNEKIRSLLADTLLNVKKHFFIKFNNGILILWF